ncbi:hypothetical protein ACLCDR_18255 [Streptomyces cavourensis]
MSELFRLVFGLLIISFGISMLGNFWNLADRMFERAASRMDPGTAAPNTFRFIGIIVILIGAVWVGTALF